MRITETYRSLEPSELIIPGDEWTLASIFASPARCWAPCDSFLGRRVRDIEQDGRILFRRREFTEIIPASPAVAT